MLPGWMGLLLRALEVALSPWREPSRLRVSLEHARVLEGPQPLLEAAVNDLLADLSRWPWRHARAAQLLGPLASALEGPLGRPALVADLVSAPAAAWLASLSEGERSFAESLLRALRAEPWSGVAVGEQAAPGRPFCGLDKTMTRAV